LPILFGLSNLWFRRIVVDLSNFVGFVEFCDCEFNFVGCFVQFLWVCGICGLRKLAGVSWWCELVGVSLWIELVGVR